MQSIQGDLLTLKEVLAYLKISRSTLLRLMAKQKITGHKVGKQWRFYRKDLQTCVQMISKKTEAAQ